MRTSFLLEEGNQLILGFGTIDRTPIDRIILKIKIWLNLHEKYF
jgi:hypothetical protein